MADALSTLATIVDHWQTQGWQLGDLAAFRMEGEGGAATPSLDSIIDAGLANEPDEPTAETPPASTPSAPATPPAAAQPAAPAAPEHADGDDTSQFGEHAAYVKQLRGEAAKYRTERNELQATFGQAFDGYDPADRDTLLTAARMMRSEDPAERAEVAEWLRSTGDTLLSTQAPAADTPLTAAQVAAEVDRVLSQRDQTKAEADAQAARLEAINKEVTDLGYAPGSTDLQVVLGIALHETNGDIAAAHAKLVARDQAAVDKFLEGKRAEAENGAVIVPQSGGAAPAATPISTIKGAKQALEAHFDSLGFK